MSVNNPVQPRSNLPRSIRKLAALIATLTLAIAGLVSFQSPQGHALPPNPQPLSSNLITDGSFEETTSGLPEGWVYFTPGTSSLIGVSQEEAKSGSNSLKVNSPDTIAAYGARSHQIPVTELKTYRASVEALIEAGAASIYLEFWNEADTRIANSFSIGQAGAGWQQLSVTAEAPAGTAYATVLLYMAKTAVGVTYFDDLKVFEPEIREPVLYGPAALTGAVRGAVLHDDLLYISGRYTTAEGNIRISSFDLNSGAIVETWDLPIAAQGGQKLASDGEYIYVGAAGNAYIWRLNPNTGESQPWANVGGAGTWIYSMDVTDGWLYFGTYPDGQVRRANLQSAAVETYGRVSTSQYASGVAVDGDYVYGGSAAPGKLLRWPKEGGVPLDLTESLSDSPVGILALVANEGRIHVASGREIISIDPDGSNRLVRTISAEDRYVDQLALNEAGELFAIARLTSNVYRVHDDRLELVATPLAEVENQLLSVTADGQIIGVSGVGHYWRVDTEGQIHVWHAADSDFGMPDNAQSMIRTSDDRVWVGGHYAMTVHDIGEGTRAVFDVRGEPKALAEGADGTVYASLYPSGEVIAINPQTLEVSSLGIIGNGQMRTTDMEFDRQGNQLLITTGPSSGGHAGAVTFVDLDTGQFTVRKDYLVNQLARAVALDGRTAYLLGDIYGEGTGNATVAPQAQVAAVNLDTKELIWVRAIDQTWDSYEDATVADSILYLMARRPNGQWLAYDLESEEIVDRGTLGGYGAFGTIDGRVFSWVHWALEIRELRSSVTTEEAVLYPSVPNGWYNNPNFAFSAEGDGTWGMWNGDLAFFSLPTSRTLIPKIDVEVEEQFVDEGTYPRASLTVSQLDDGEWPVEAGAAIPLKVSGRLLGPFDTLPDGASLANDNPVAWEGELVVDDGPGDYQIEAEGFVGEQGFYAWQWQVIRKDQETGMARRLVGDSASQYTAENSLIGVRGSLATTVVSSNFEAGESAEIKIEISGFPVNQGAFAGAQGWPPDQSTIRHLVYGPIEPPEMRSGSPEAPLIASATTVATNGIHTLTFDGEESQYQLGEGTYFVLSEFTGDSRTAPYRTSLDSESSHFQVAAKATQPPDPNLTDESSEGGSTSNLANTGPDFSPAALLVLLSVLLGGAWVSAVVRSPRSPKKMI